MEQKTFESRKGSTETDSVGCKREFGITEIPD